MQNHMENRIRMYSTCCTPIEGIFIDLPQFPGGNGSSSLVVKVMLEVSLSIIYDSISTRSTNVRRSVQRGHNILIIVDLPNRLSEKVEHRCVKRNLVNFVMDPGRTNDPNFFLSQHPQETRYTLIA